MAMRFSKLDSRLRPQTGGWLALFSALLAFVLTSCAGSSGGGTQSFVLSVGPAQGFVATGSRFGPIEATTVYSIENQRSKAFTWEVSTTSAWVSLSAASGTLQSGETVLIEVTVDTSVTAKMNPGEYQGQLVFRDRSGAAPDVIRSLRLILTRDYGDHGGASLTKAEQLGRFGIRWKFSKAHQVGRFANGDWWVVGPVSIVGIDPPSTTGARTMNGSMINPDPAAGTLQGYDSAMYGSWLPPGQYDPALNAALNISPATPLVVQPGSSLVSTISYQEEVREPQFKTAAILTVLSAPAPENSFRPAYSGTDKTIRFNRSQLDYSVLANLQRVPSTPDIDQVARMFERPWLQHIPTWMGRFLHPQENMPNYGREISDTIGIAGLLLNLNFTKAEKEQLLIRFVQLGIDLQGIVANGGDLHFEPLGGHGSGRKLPILFAGLVLGDPEMLAIGQNPNVVFGEDGQTFYVEETSPGVYNHGFGGYGPQHVGMPEWGTTHIIDPQHDDVRWDFGSQYRLCCTANAWGGIVLTARIMGAVDLWNHDPLFDYMDRYIETARDMGNDERYISWSPFPIDMWDAYRAQY